MHCHAIRLSVMVIALSTFASLVTGAGYAQEHRFAVRGVIVDSSGAVIPQAEVVFKGESGTFVSHTGMDGSVNVHLEAGKYLLTISAVGFATKLADFSVPGATADIFRVVLNSRSEVRADRYHEDIGVPTVPSELPNIIKDEPTRSYLPVVQSVTTKRRSMRCLYLWRCSGL